MPRELYLLLFLLIVGELSILWCLVSKEESDGD